MRLSQQRKMRLPRGRRIFRALTIRCASLLVWAVGARTAVMGLVLAQTTQSIAGVRFTAPCSTCLAHALFPREPGVALACTAASSRIRICPHTSNNQVEDVDEADYVKTDGQVESVHTPVQLSSRTQPFLRLQSQSLRDFQRLLRQA